MGSEARFRIHVGGYVGDAVAAAAATAAAGVASAGATSAPTASFICAPCLEKSQLLWVIF